MPTPFSRRTVVSIRDLSTRPDTKYVLLCSGDRESIPGFSIGVDNLWEREMYLEGRVGERAVVMLSKDMPFVVFAHDAIEFLTTEDRLKLGAADNKARESLAREYDPDAAALYDAAKAARVAASSASPDVETTELKPAYVGQYV